MRAHTLISLLPRKLAFRFVTSIVLGIAYGRRISDLKDDMVTFNYNSILGKRHEAFPEEHDLNCSPQSSSGEFNSGLGTIWQLMGFALMTSAWSVHPRKLTSSLLISLDKFSTPGKYIVETVRDMYHVVYYYSHLEHSGRRFCGFPYVLRLFLADDLRDNFVTLAAIAMVPPST